ncbi:hypothetical protein FQN53_003083 [Emmonsiellopsis sp. PD_33]|nr:hypothetical protein FQN53_003083 [Emmonsiellopsis sp. PD_33]
MDFLLSLCVELIPEARVLADPTDAEFRRRLERWTDIEKKVPSAIILPATENDIEKIILLAVELQIPFVPKSGGFSMWSTIGSEGFILDLSLYRDVQLDLKKQQVTICGGATVGEVNSVTVKEGFVASLGFNNALGAISSTINGGIGPLVSHIGYGSDNIISARLVTAEGNLITVSDTENSELFYAIRGAGQFFGLVTSITMRMFHTPSVLGTPDNTVWRYQIVFPIERAEEVINTMTLIAAMDPSSSGAIMCMSQGPAPKLKLQITGVYLGSKTQGEACFKPILDLGPIRYWQLKDLFSQDEDLRLGGGLRHVSSIGTQNFDPEMALEALGKFQEFVSSFPEACERLTFEMDWIAEGVASRVGELGCVETAWAHRDVKIWTYIMHDYTDPSHEAFVQLLADEIRAILRRNQPFELQSSYQAITRKDPIEMRYRPAERLEKLRHLKKTWDPRGVFTREFLDY